MENVDYLPQQIKPIVAQDMETVQGVPSETGDEMDKSGEELESIETDDTQSSEMAAHTSGTYIPVLTVYFDLVTTCIYNHLN